MNSVFLCAFVDGRASVVRVEEVSTIRRRSEPNGEDDGTEECIGRGGHEILGRLCGGDHQKTNDGQKNYGRMGERVYFLIQPMYGLLQPK